MNGLRLTLLVLGGLGGCKAPSDVHVTVYLSPHVNLASRGHRAGVHPPSPPPGHPVGRAH